MDGASGFPSGHALADKPGPVFFATDGEEADIAARLEEGQEGGVEGFAGSGVARRHGRAQGQEAVNRGQFLFFRKKPRLKGELFFSRTSLSLTKTAASASPGLRLNRVSTNSQSLRMRSPASVFGSENGVGVGDFLFRD